MTAKHERQLIREAVVALLTGAAPDYATSAGPRVFKSRMTPLRPGDLPAIIVYSDNEEVNPGSAQTAPRRLTRDGGVVIEGYVSVSADVDDAMDAFALEIETVMDADTWLSETVRDSILKSTEIAIDPDSKTPIACVRLIYAVDYRTEQRLEPLVDVFDTADTKVSLSGAQAPADRAEDLVTGINQE